MSDLQEGDQVIFSIGNNEQIGTIQDKLTTPTDVDLYNFHVAKQDPHFIVKHAHTGTEFNRKANQIHELEDQAGEVGFEAGDTVKFNIGRNELLGTVEERLTEPTNIGGHIVHASEQDPQYVIIYDKTGAEVNRRADQIHEA